MPRFHLSTLLLFTIFCGAAVGIWTERKNWKALPADSSIQFRELKKKETGNGVFWYEPVPHLSAARTFFKIPDRIVCVNPDSGHLEIYARNEWAGALEFDGAVGDAGVLSCFYSFTDDGRYVDIQTELENKTFYRIRPYGVRGWTTFPLFWIAIISLGMLLVIFVGWVKKQYRPKKTDS